MSNHISRRNLLKGMGLGALGFGFGLTPSLAAQVTPGSQSTIAYYRFQLGDLNITNIHDGTLTIPTNLFGANAEEGAVDALLEANRLPTGMMTSIANLLLVESGDRLALMDTGYGDFTMGGPMSGGKLLETLAALGVDAGSVTDVVITHFHPDHVGGLAFEDGAAFPNAMVHFPQVEWDFLSEQGTGTEEAAFFDYARFKMQPYVDNDQVSFYTDGQDILSGVTAMAAPGHTPGHHALMFSSGDQTLLNMVDTTNHFVIGLQHPEWYFGFDAMPDMAVETRRNTLEMAAEDGIQVFGYHFPFPGIGYVLRDGDAYRFLATG